MKNIPPFSLDQSSATTAPRPPLTSNHFIRLPTISYLLSSISSQPATLSSHQKVTFPKPTQESIPTFTSNIVSTTPIIKPKPIAINANRSPSGLQENIPPISHQEVQSTVSEDNVFKRRRMGSEQIQM